MRRHGYKQKLKMALILSVVALMFIGAYAALSAWEAYDSQISHEEAKEDDDKVPSEDAGYVYFNGKAYIPREQLTTLLLLGIDDEGKVEASGSYLNDGQNDFNALIVLDETSDTYTIIWLNRDTMTAVRRLGIGGTVVDSYTMQLALAHTYGSGLEDSCENAVAAVEDFLYGIEVDHYISLNMTAVEIMVDAIGGITVTIQDDFSAIDTSLVFGETMTLNGAQCLTYIRSRKDVGDETNLSRSERQKTFIYELMSQMHEKKDDVISELVSVTDYLVTDMSATKLKKMFENICDAHCNGIITPEGEVVLGDEYIEFYADDDSVKEIVISLFYEPVED